MSKTKIDPNTKEKPLCEGIQHTRAIIAIGIIQYCIDTFQAKPKSAMAERLARIQKRVDEVSVETQKRRTSRGTLRVLDKYLDIMEQETAKEYANEDEYYRAWERLWFTGYEYLEEVRTTCPIYWNGKYRKSWQLLLRMAENLAVYIKEHYPESEEQGVLFYLKLSDALKVA